MSEWETVELSDGRVGVYRHGICVHVARSHDEATAWWKNRVRSETDTRPDQDKGLGRAVQRM